MARNSMPEDEDQPGGPEKRQRDHFLLLPRVHDTSPSPLRQGRISPAARQTDPGVSARPSALSVFFCSARCSLFSFRFWHKT